jgi:hypothetical protein
VLVLAEDTAEALDGLVRPDLRRWAVASTADADAGAPAPRGG